MSTTRYVKFRKYLLRNDAEAALLLYDYFLEMPKLNSIVLRRTLYYIKSIFRPAIALLFAFKLGIILPSKRINADFLIFRQGHGMHATKIYLIKDLDGRYKIIKKYPNAIELEKELAFIHQYQGKSKTIAFPDLRKVDSTTAEMSFLKSMNLAEQILSGEISTRHIPNIYKRMAEALNDLYRGENEIRCLINGDLGPTNVYIINGKFHLIDFSDSHIYYKEYDTFNFLRRLLYYYSEKEKSDMLEGYFNKQDVARYNKHRLALKVKKHYE